MAVFPYRIVDCTQILQPNCPCWPGTAQTFSITPACTISEHGFQTYDMHTDCGIGTHVDSPAHFIVGARTVADLSPAELTSPLVLLHCESQCTQDRDYELTVSDLLDWESLYGRIPERALVCMSTGFGQRFADDDSQAYRNCCDLSQPNQMHFPGVSAAVAEFLTTQRNIVGVGIDTLSLDRGISSTFDCHWTMFRNDKYQVENLLLDAMLPSSGAIMCVSPLKITIAAESPARVWVFVPL